MSVVFFGVVFETQDQKKIKKKNTKTPSHLANGPWNKSLNLFSLLNMESPKRLKPVSLLGQVTPWIFGWPTCRGLICTASSKSSTLSTTWATRCARVFLINSLGVLGPWGWDGKPPTWKRTGILISWVDVHPYYWVDEFIPYYMEIMGV